MARLVAKFGYISVHCTLLYRTSSCELIAVRLKNINFERGHIEVVASAHYENSQYIFTKPKTKKSERIVTIPQFLTQMIRNHVKRYYFIDLEEQVFMTNKDRLSRRIAKYSEIARVKRIRVHDLRHSHASLLIEQGIQPNIVQDRLGHEKIETTLRTYSHLFPNKQYNLASFLDQLAENSAPSSIESQKSNPIMIETVRRLFINNRILISSEDYAHSFPFLFVLVRNKQVTCRLHHVQDLTELNDLGFP